MYSCMRCCLYCVLLKGTVFVQLHVLFFVQLHVLCTLVCRIVCIVLVLLVGLLLCGRTDKRPIVDVANQGVLQSDTKWPA